jgi:hypothetical protein
VELQLAILKEYIAKAGEHTLDDLLAVREQNELLRTVKQKVSVGGRQISFLSETDELEISHGRLLTEASVNNRRTTQKELFGVAKARIPTQSSDDIRVRRRQLSQADVSSVLAEIE